MQSLPCGSASRSTNLRAIPHQSQVLGRLIDSVWVGAWQHRLGTGSEPIPGQNRRVGRGPNASERATSAMHAVLRRSHAPLGASLQPRRGSRVSGCRKRARSGELSANAGHTARALIPDPPRHVKSEHRDRRDTNWLLLCSNGIFAAPALADKPGEYNFRIARSARCDRGQPCLLPPGMLGDDLPRTLIEVVGLVDIAMFRAGQRGACSAQHELCMMSALVICRRAIPMLSSPHVARSGVRCVAVGRHRDFEAPAR